MKSVPGKVSGVWFETTDKAVVLSSGEAENDEGSHKKNNVLYYGHINLGYNG